MKRLVVKQERSSEWVVRLCPEILDTFGFEVYSLNDPYASGQGDNSKPVSSMVSLQKYLQQSAIAAIDVAFMVRTDTAVQYKYASCQFNV